MIQGYVIYNSEYPTPNFDVSNCINQNFGGFLFREADVNENKEFLELFNVSSTPTYLFLEDLGGGRFKDRGRIEGLATDRQLCDVVNNLSIGQGGEGEGESFFIRGNADELAAGIPFAGIEGLKTGLGKYVSIGLILLGLIILSND